MHRRLPVWGLGLPELAGNPTAASLGSNTASQTPLPSLTAALGGSIAGSFVELAGPPGVGKTQFCFHLAALAAAAGGNVYWLDAEQTFSPQRMLELLKSAMLQHSSRTSGAHPTSNELDQIECKALCALGRIRHRVCRTLQELHTVLLGLYKQITQAHFGDTGRKHPSGGETTMDIALPALVVVDSIASVARNEGDVHANRHAVIPRRQAVLSAMASLLKELVAHVPGAQQTALAYRPPGVVVTNQVAGDPTGGASKVTLGHVWHHAVNWRLVLSHMPPGFAQRYGTKEVAAGDRRFLHVEKSPSSPPITVQFAIGAGGLVEFGVLGPPGWASSHSTVRLQEASLSSGGDVQQHSCMPLAGNMCGMQCGKGG